MDKKEFFEYATKVVTYVGGNALNSQQRKELLEKSIAFACADLGIENFPTVKFVNMNEQESRHKDTGRKINSLIGHESEEGVTERINELLETEDEYYIYKNCVVLYNSADNQLEFNDSKLNQLFDADQLLYIIHTCFHECRHAYQEKTQMELIAIQYNDYMNRLVSSFAWYASEDEADADEYGYKKVAELAKFAKETLNKKDYKMFSEAYTELKLTDGNKDKCMHAIAKHFRKFFHWLDVRREKKEAVEDKEFENEK